MIQRLTQKKQFGPGDHGRRMSYDEFMTADYQEGYKYEIIDGELYVSPEANADHEWAESGLYDRLRDYAREHAEIINKVSCKARVFVSSRPRATVPEPDLAVYHNYPQRRPRGGRQWENVSPILVAEVISPDSADKDRVRNVELYWEVPSIKEYWLFDLQETAQYPLTVHRRQTKRWKILRVAAGETYTTPLLPGFELLVEPNNEDDEEEAQP
jgi:Uma2 family endonuclease